MAAKHSSKVKRLKFTSSDLDKLPVPEKGRQSYIDTHPKSNGLRLDVLASGRMVFYTHVTASVDGKPQTKKPRCGEWPYTKLPEARDNALEQRNLAAKGIDTVAERREQRAVEAVLSLTVEDAVDEFCQKQRKGSSEKPLKEKTQADYKWGIEKFLGEDRYKAPLANLTREIITECYEDRLEQSKARAALEARSLSSVWNWIARQDAYEDHIPENPVEALKKKRKLYRPERRHGRLEVKQDLNELRDWMDEVEKLDPITREFFEWMLFTGNRLGEATGLQWEDIAWKSSEYVLHDPKNRRTTTLPLPGYLKPRLLARKQRKGPVFPVKHLGRTARQKVAEALNKHWTNHDLRRSFSGFAAGARVGHVAIKQLMNHTIGGDITDGYIGESADLHEELARVEEHILRLAGRSDNVSRLKVVS